MMLFLDVHGVSPVAVFSISYLIEHLSPEVMQLPKFANRISPHERLALNNYEGATRSGSPPSNSTTPCLWRSLRLHLAQKNNFP